MSKTCIAILLAVVLAVITTCARFKGKETVISVHLKKRDGSAAAPLASQNLWEWKKFERQRVVGEWRSNQDTSQSMPVTRDPFQPDFDGMAGLGSGTDRVMLFAVESLRLVGIIQSGDRVVALLEDPFGQGYPVYAGSRVGDQNGVIQKIDADEIQIFEPPSEKNAGRGRLIALKLKGEKT